MKECKKKPFLTRATARRFKRHIHRIYGGKQHTIYRCADCSAFHLTTMSRDVARKVIYGLFDGAPVGTDTQEGNEYIDEEWPIEPDAAGAVRTKSAYEKADNEDNPEPKCE